MEMGYAVRIAVSAMCAIAWVVATPVCAQSHRFDFRGAEIGMPIAAWKSISPPGEFNSPATTTCSSDPNPPAWLVGRMVDVESAAGMVLCTYTYESNGDVYPAHGLRIGGYEITSADYYFLDGLLARIELVAEAGALDTIGSALTSKFGPPTHSKNSTTRNGLGEPLPKTELEWSAPGQALVVESPAIQTDRLTVTYSDLAAERRVQAATESLHPGRSNM